MSIEMENLPEKWYCSMNTWAPAYSKCNAKEEPDDNKAPSITTMTAENSEKYTSPAVNKSNKNIRRPPTTSSVPDLTSIGEKRVTQWVQCEKRTCKKWRKLPGHVDMKQLPEKWFCEMNIWNPERANCDCSDDSDSDVDNTVPGDRSQILTNVKGPGSLSYRRIIFGPDGKVRATYNEKSKTSYGLFSFADNQKSASTEEPPDFQKKVGYWWSSAYDESGADFVSAFSLL